MTSEPPATADFSKVSVRTLIAYILIGGFCGCLFVFIITDEKMESVWPVAIVIALLYGTLLTWALRHCSHAGSDLRHLLGPLPTAGDWRPLVALLPFYLMVAGILMVQDTLLPHMWSPSDRSIERAIFAHPVAKVFMCAMYIVIIPFVEEVVWRGMILRRWAYKWGVHRGLIFTSLFFGLIHGRSFLFATLFGFLLGLLYLRSKTLWLPIAAHAVWNLQAVFMPYQLSNLGGWPAGLGYIVTGAILLWLMRDIYMPRLPLTLAPLPRSVPRQTLTA